MGKKTVTFWLVVLLSLLCAGPATFAGAADVYDFEGLMQNSLIHAQDNWVDQPGQGQAWVKLDRTTNLTLVVSHLSTVAFDESAFITRVNDINFSFVPFSGTETDAVVQFDANGEGVSWFGLGRDVDGNRLLDVSWAGQSLTGELGPAFGVNDRNFVIQACDGTLLQTAFGSGNNGSDSYRMQLRIDFTANSGDGAGSLYYMNLTDRDRDFLPLAALQNVNLRLNQMHADAGPSAWDAIWIHVRTMGGDGVIADNLFVQGGTSVCTDRDQDGYALEGGDCGPVDCDDDRPEIHPGSLEICGNSIDENCDGFAEFCSVHDVAVTSLRVPIKVRNCSSELKRTQAELLNPGEFTEVVSVKFTADAAVIEETSVTLDSRSVAQVLFWLNPMTLAGPTAEICVEAFIPHPDAGPADNKACAPLTVVDCQ